MNTQRSDLSYLIQTGLIPQDKVEQALIASKITPNKFAWAGFIEKLLLWLGALALTSSVLFFIAYNWDAMGRFAKFSLVEALIGLSIISYWKTYKSKQLLGQMSLLIASILVGVLLAFYGQTYQTGADTWELFLTWSILIIPWTLLSRFPVQWIFWLLLLNTSAFIYLETFRGVFSFLFSSGISELWPIVIINGTALILWEILDDKLKWLSSSWATRLLAVASGSALTILVIDSIFSRHHNLIPSVIPGIVWLVAMIMLFVVYRKLKPDLFMLAMGCLSGISVIIGLSAKFLFDIIDIELGAFFILAILVVALGGATAIWLKHTHKAISLIDGGKI